MKNKTKNIVIASESKICTGIWDQARGLMFTKKHNKALVFKFKKEKIISLHMFFVFYPIDVLFLSKNKVVVDQKENFMPFSFYKSSERSMFAIELPSGTIKKTGTKIGDKISF